MDQTVTRSDRPPTLNQPESAQKGFESLVDPGEGITIDRTIGYYSHAFEAGQHDPHFLNDFAFALISRGRPDDLILGADYAARARTAAIRIDAEGDLAQAARFNWAVALKRLGLHGQATGAWQAVLDHEADPAWRDEAELQLAELTRWPVASWPEERRHLQQAAAVGDTAAVAEGLSSYRTAARLAAEDDALRVWAESSERDPVRAAQALAIARTFGAVLAATGDGLLADVVAAIDRTPENARSRAQLAAASRMFFSGLEAYQNFDYETARPLLATAAARLADLGSPLSWRARLFAVVASDHLGLADHLDAFDELLEDLPKRYASIAAQARYGRGRSHVTAGYPEASLHDLELAVASLETLGEADLTPSYRSQLASALRDAHRDEDAAIHEGNWLTSSSIIVHPYYRLFVSMALEARALQAGALEVYGAAAWESAALAEATGRQSLISDAMTGLFSALCRLQRTDEAREVQASIQASIDRLEDARDRWRSEADLLRARASCPPLLSEPNRRELLAKALWAYDQANTTGTESRLVPQQVHVLLEVAEEYLLSGQFAQARDSAERASELLVQRLRFAAPTQRLAANIRPIVDVRLLASLRDSDSPDSPEVLFNWVEKGYHLSAPGPWSPPTDLDTIRERLADGTVLVHLTPLADNILVLTLSRHSIESRWLKTPNLSSLVTCLDPRETDCAGWDSTGRQLAQVSIEPWICTIRAGERLVLVPGPLARVPFSGLPVQCGDEPEQRLVDRHISSLAPSATFWTEAGARAASLAADPPTHIVAIGSRVAQGFPQPLPFAEEEALKVAAVYPTGLALIGDEATPSAIRSASDQADVIHFATHGAIDPMTTDGSFLALAQSRLRVGDLTDRALGNLPRARLVALSACDSGGALQGIEGLAGVSRAFLELGVPTVLVTVAPIDDSFSNDLMIRFHDRFLATGDAARALAEAQREHSSMANSVRRFRTTDRREGPPHWARWVTVGG
ncbi:MAG: CHAT domain-containing protein [Acidobacteriota bacterium]